MMAQCSQRVARQNQRFRMPTEEGRQAALENAAELAAIWENDRREAMGAQEHFPSQFDEPVFTEPKTKPLTTSIRYSAELGKLAEALAKAQLEFEAVTKSAENPAYK